MKLVLLVGQEMHCWGALAEKYNEKYSMADVLELARRRYPEVVRDEEADEVEGDVQDEDDCYVMTWEDGMGECMRIYEKTN